jgi:hypothetical protein
MDIQHYLDAARDPATTDDASAGFSQGSICLYTSTGNSWICAVATVAAAVWRPLGRVPVDITAAADAACVLPAGGTWWYQIHGFSAAGALLSGISGTGAGGATVGTATAGTRWRGFAARIA